MGFSSDVAITKSYLVVDPELNFTPEISSGVGTNLGTVVLYSPNIDGINVYDIVLFKDKNQDVIQQPEENTKFILVNFDDVLMINHPPL